MALLRCSRRVGRNPFGQLAGLITSNEKCQAQKSWPTYLISSRLRQVPRQMSAGSAGLPGDPATRAMFVTADHRCYANDGRAVELEHQEELCMTAAHVKCPLALRALASEQGRWGTKGKPVRSRRRMVWAGSAFRSSTDRCGCDRFSGLGQLG